jgi:hypothetical protein
MLAAMRRASSRVIQYSDLKPSYIGEQHVVMPAQGIQGPSKRDETQGMNRVPW